MLEGFEDRGFFGPVGLLAAGRQAVNNSDFAIGQLGAQNLWSLGCVSESERQKIEKIVQVDLK